MQHIERVVNAPAEAVSKSVEPLIAPEPKVLPETNAEISPATAEETGWSINTLDFLFGIYGLITLFLLIRFAGGLMEIRNKIKAGSHQKMDQATLVLLDEPITPQSFFGYIFLDKEQFESGEIEPEILDHEITHIRQLHSLDVLFVELLKVIFWFNPLMYLYKHAVQLNHEFLADESVVKNGSSVTGYQNMLIRVCAGNKSMNTTSSINYSLTKKRLKMMGKSFSALRSGSKLGFIIPVLLLLTLSFCSRQQEDVSNRLNDELYSNVKLHIDYDLNKEMTGKNPLPRTHFDESGNPFTGVQEMRFVKNDSLFSKSVYKEGIIQSTTAYFENGSLMGKSEFGYIGDQFKTTRQYNKDGILIEEWIYPSEGNPAGTIREWHPNGQLKYEAFFTGNLQFEGLMTLYDEQGNIIEQERYEGGELIDKIK